MLEVLLQWKYSFCQKASASEFLIPASSKVHELIGTFQLRWVREMDPDDTFGQLYICLICSPSMNFCCFKL